MAIEVTTCVTWASQVKTIDHILGEKHWHPELIDQMGWLPPAALMRRLLHPFDPCSLKPTHRAWLTARAEAYLASWFDMV